MIFGYDYEVYLTVIGLIIISILALFIVDYFVKKAKDTTEKSEKLNFLHESQYKKIANFIARLTKPRNE